MERSRLAAEHGCSFLLFLTRSLSIPSEVLGMPSEEEVDLLLRKFGACFRPEPLPKDQRRCCFCNQQGDGQTDGPARLLNLDLDLWVSLLDTRRPTQTCRMRRGAAVHSSVMDMFCLSGPPQLCSVVQRGLRDSGRRSDQRGAGAAAWPGAPLCPLSAAWSHQWLQPLPLHQHLPLHMRPAGQLHLLQGKAAESLHVLTQAAMLG